MLDGMDIEVLATVVQQVSRNWARLSAQFPGVPGQVTVPVTAAEWDRVEPIMRRVVPLLPYVDDVRLLDHIDGPVCYRGWAILCSPRPADG